MNKRVLLLGAGGQLGSLIRQKAPVGLPFFAYNSKELDITNEEGLSETFAEVDPTIIINTAAYTQVDQAELDAEKAFAVNAQGLKNIAQHAPFQCNVIHISTDFVFDGTQASPYKPEDLTKPLGIYGQSKLEGEKQLLMLRPNNSAIIRTSWLYSALGKNFVNTMLSLMAQRTELQVVSDQIGSPTSAHTLARVIWQFALADESGSGIFHWSDAGVASWYEFACAIQKQALELGLLKKEIKIKALTSKEYPTLAKRPAYSVLECSRLCELLDVERKPWQAELLATLAEIKPANS